VTETTDRKTEKTKDRDKRQTTIMSAPKFRPMRFGVTRAVLREGQPGVRYLRADQD